MTTTNYTFFFFFLKRSLWVLYFVVVRIFQLMPSFKTLITEAYFSSYQDNVAHTVLYFLFLFPSGLCKYSLLSIHLWMSSSGKSKGWRELSRPTCDWILIWILTSKQELFFVCFSRKTERKTGKLERRGEERVKTLDIWALLDTVYRETRKCNFTNIRTSFCSAWKKKIQVVVVAFLTFYIIDS